MSENIIKMKIADPLCSLIDAHVLSFSLIVVVINLFLGCVGFKWDNISCIIVSFLIAIGWSLYLVICCKGYQTSH